MEKALKFEQKEQRNHALRKSLCIVIAIVLTLIDVQYFVDKLKSAFPWEFGNYYSSVSVERQITTGDIILTGVIIFVVIITCICLIGVSERIMSHNIAKENSRIIFDYLSVHDSVQVQLKRIYGVQHSAYVTLMLSADEGQECKLYVKNLDGENLYIWASNEKGEELDHWVETPNEFFHYFIIEEI